MIHLHDTHKHTHTHTHTPQAMFRLQANQICFSNQIFWDDWPHCYLQGIRLDLCMTNLSAWVAVATANSGNVSTFFGALQVAAWTLHEQHLRHSKFDIIIVCWVVTQKTLWDPIWVSEPRGICRDPFRIAFQATSKYGLDVICKYRVFFTVQTFKNESGYILDLPKKQDLGWQSRQGLTEVLIIVVLSWQGWICSHSCYIFARYCHLWSNEI